MEGSFSLIIRGNSLDIEVISRHINLQPTKIKRKGELVTSKQAMIDDYWTYKVEFDNSEFENAFETFLIDVMPSNEFMKNIAITNEVYIFFSLRSNLGQMGFELNPTILKALANMNIKLEVHILSYGEVEYN